MQVCVYKTQEIIAFQAGGVIRFENWAQLGPYNIKRVEIIILLGWNIVWLGEIFTQHMLDLNI